MPGEHLLAGLLAEVGVEDVARRALPGVDLGDAGEGRHDAAQRVDVRFVEAARAAGGEARGVNLAADELHRQREEVRPALVAQLFQDREIERAAVANAPPHLDVLREDDLQRTPQVLVGVLDADRRADDLDGVARLVPDEAASGDVRDAVQRHALIDQTVAEVMQHVLRPARGLGAAIQPLDDGLDVQSLRSHRLDSIAPRFSGSRASTPFNFCA